jgi:hypothetical protein
MKKKSAVEPTAAEIAKVLKLRREEKGYVEIEKEMGWPANRGYRAYRIIQRAGGRNVDIEKRNARAKVTRAARKKMVAPAEPVSKPIVVIGE